MLFGGYSFAWNFSVWAPTPMSLGYSGGTYTNPVNSTVGGRQNYRATSRTPAAISTSSRCRIFATGGRNRKRTVSYSPGRTRPSPTAVLLRFYYANGSTQGNLCETVAPSFTRGNLPANSGSRQRIIGANASVYKDFTIKERFKAELRFDYYNPFKWYNWSAVNTTMTQSTPATFMTPGINENGIPPKADRRKFTFRSA